MACSKYTLTNTGSTIINFSYRRCDDSLWDYQVELLPGQTKNIWVINGTYTISQAFKGSVEVIEGVFPPIFTTPTPTPTPSVTPFVTSTPTPSVTPTITPSPTEPIRYNQANICHNEFNGDSVCDCPGLANVYTDGVDLASSTIMFSDATGPNTGNPVGYYQQGGIIYQVASDCGPGCTTGATITSIGVCGPTPTPTPTMTQTPTSPLQVFNVFTGSTPNEACENGIPSVIYAFNPLFDANTQFYNDALGVVTEDMSGFYTDGTSVTEIDSNGLQVGSFTLCGSVETPTPTPTMTQTPTQTFAWYTYILSSGATANDACTAFTSSTITVYGSIVGGVGPNVGEVLYETAGIPLTDTIPDGYYSNGVAVFQVTGGLGEITSSDPNGCI